MAIKITPTDTLKTFNLGKYEGKEATPSRQQQINDTIIDEPEEVIGGGESFDEFSTRVLDEIKSLIKIAVDKTAVVTHNSLFGLIKLWDKKGRPDNLNYTFRKEYTKQDSETGDFYTIKSDNGIIYICRHGETEDNKDGNFRADNTKLTTKGEEQAENLGKELAKTGISEIICSSLPRAIHTSELIVNEQEPMEEEKNKPKIEDETTENSKDEKTEMDESDSKGLSRSAFLYMEPDVKNPSQCGSCKLFVDSKKRCTILGNDIEILATDSCGLYIPGKPIESQEITKSLSPEEVGLVHEEVTCKNCHYFAEDGDCLLFRILGMKNYKVKKNGCCNAFSSKGSDTD